MPSVVDGCPECGGRLPFGMVVPGVFDGILYWVCRGCGFAWPRWWDGPRAAVSAEFAEAVNARRRAGGA